MKRLRLPLLLAALPLAAPPARAAMFVTEAEFFRDLGRIQLGLREQIQAAAVTQGQALPNHEETYRIVLRRLAGFGVPESYVLSAFSDPRVQILESVVERFKKPAESLPYEDYRRIFITEAKIQAGIQFYAEHKELLSDVGRRSGVDTLILVSLVGVETHYGRAPGSTPVFSALYTITRRIPPRSEWAGRELAELLKLCHREGFDPHGLAGSYAGAFGFGQFLPSSFNAYAVDFDGDGRRRYDDWPDVLGSVANYLTAHGYRSGADPVPGSPIWQALYAYNHSDNYVRVILELRQAVLERLPAV